MARDTAAWTDPNCPVARAVDVVGDRWSLLIVRDAMDGARSFTDFQQRTGIARNILADRLDKLVDAGILERVPYQERPLRHEYRLTAKGRDLSPALIALMRWGDRWANDGEAPTHLVHDACGTELEQLLRCPSCDVEVTPTHIRSRSA